MIKLTFSLKSQIIFIRLNTNFASKILGQMSPLNHEKCNNVALNKRASSTCYIMVHVRTRINHFYFHQETISSQSFFEFHGNIPPKRNYWDKIIPLTKFPKQKWFHAKLNYNITWHPFLLVNFFFSFMRLIKFFFFLFQIA